MKKSKISHTKKTKLFRHEIEVRSSKVQGYGVFASNDIKKGEVIEECYALVLNTDVTELENYVFSATSDPYYKTSLLALGYGCVYNHSDKPNATYKLNRKRSLITFTATKNIKQGDEIFTSYGKGWFADRTVRKK